MKSHPVADLSPLPVCLYMFKDNLKLLTFDWTSDKEKERNTQCTFALSSIINLFNDYIWFEFKTNCVAEKCIIPNYYKMSFPVIPLIQKWDNVAFDSMGIFFRVT